VMGPVRYCLSRRWVAATDENTITGHDLQRGAGADRTAEKKKRITETRTGPLTFRYGDGTVQKSDCQGQETGE
jgi:hypothetical protein